MKKTLILLLITIFLLSLIECKKSEPTVTVEDTTDDVTGDTTGDVIEDITEDTTTIENITQYVKHSSAWLYANEEDLGKKPGEVKEKKLVYFGNKITVVSSKKINDKEYYIVQLPDKTEYWGEKDYFAIKFIVINQSDVACYSQPDISFKTNIKLQPGDFGIFEEEMDGWVSVNFKAYRPYVKDGERKWVGKRWIKEGYIDNLETSKEAYYLYLAYYWNIQKDNKEKAIDMLNKALAINGGVESEITYVIKDYLNEIKSIPEETTSDINR